MTMHGAMATLLPLEMLACVVDLDSASGGKPNATPLGGMSIVLRYTFSCHLLSNSVQALHLLLAAHDAC